MGQTAARRDFSAGYSKRRSVTVSYDIADMKDERGQV